MMVSRICASPSSSRGVALITALLIVALATTAAVTMVSRQQLDIRRTGNLLQMEQSYLYVQWAEDFAAHVLRDDWVQDNTAGRFVDHESEDWAIDNLPPSPVDGGTLAGVITDVQGRFNINSMVTGGVVNPAARQRFENLLIALVLDDYLASAVVDWLDADGLPTAGGTEDYSGKVPPYAAANRTMVSPSELLLVEGFDQIIAGSNPEQTVYERLKEHVCALPERVTEININTASTAVLRSLDSRINDVIAGDLIAARDVDGFDNPGTFNSELNNLFTLHGITVPTVTIPNISVNSSYFMLNSTIELGQAHLKMQSLLYRESTGTTQTLARAQGLY